MLRTGIARARAANLKAGRGFECALVIQMACTQSAAMAVLSRLGEGRGGDRGVAAMASAAVEALRRLRNGGSQIVRVEHVYVNEGGQAIIGNVQRNGADEFTATQNLDRDEQ